MTTTQNSNFYLNPTLNISKCPLDYTDNGIECISNRKGFIEIFKTSPCPPNSTEEPYDGPVPDLGRLVKKCRLNNENTPSSRFNKCAVGYVPNKDNTRCVKPCNSGYEQIGETCIQKTVVDTNDKAKEEAEKAKEEAEKAAAAKKKKIIIGISSIGVITIIGISIFFIIRFRKN